MMFLKSLVEDTKGQPDEAALAFLLALCTLIVGAVLRAFGYAFPLCTFATAVCALIPLYKATRGDWRP